MKRVVTILLCALFLAITALPSPARKVVVVADSDFPPYIFKHKGSYDGIYVRILQRIFARMQGYEVEMRYLPWKRALAEVEHGAAFAVIPPYYRPIKRPWMHPYSAPIFTEVVVAFCRKPVMKMKRPQFPEDYFGLTFGNNRGFASGGLEFFSAVDAGHIVMVEADSSRKNMERLLSSRIDCFVIDRQSGLWALKQLKESNKLRDRMDTIVEAHVVKSEDVYLGFSRTVDATDFIKQFNALLREMQNTGEVDRIVRKFIP